MLGKAKTTEEAPVFMMREGQTVLHLNREAMQWLGQRYEWYNKIRTAKKGGLKIFKEASLEEQMEATRSALVLVSNTLNTSLMMAYNAVIDAVKNLKNEPEDWPGKVEGDRASAPLLTPEQDATVIAWSPVKFLNLAKQVRDKGKGLDFYVDGLVKKTYFKVIGYYSDPRNWDPERMGYFLTGLEPDAGLQEVQGRLGSLKSEMDLFVLSLFPFKFGKVSRRKEAGQKNAIDDTFDISDDELKRDLYFQTYLWTGLDRFFFRYYATLLSATENPRALRQISNIFHPVLAKISEINHRFQSSFATEREKLRIRKDFIEFQKQRESLPPVETIEVKGRQVRRINYTMRLLEGSSYSRAMQFNDRQKAVWVQWLETRVLGEMNAPLGYGVLLEILNTMIWDTMCSMEGKVKAAGDMRAFSDEQEKLGKLQLAQHKKRLEEEKRKKARAIGKFKAQEQMNMVETITKEMEELVRTGTARNEQMEEGIKKRREAMIARVDQLETAARKDREENLGKNAAALFNLIPPLDENRSFRGGLVAYLMNHLQEDKEETAHLLYRNLFSVIDDLFPTEKMMLRSAIAQKMTLEENDLQVSAEDMQAYQQQIVTRKAELNTEVPGLLEQRLSQGPVPVKVEELLNLNLTGASLRLLLSLNFSGTNMPSGKIPGEAVKKLLMLNQLTNPLPEHDIILPNVEASAQALKRVNFNRLQKLMG